MGTTTIRVDANTHATLLELASPLTATRHGLSLHVEVEPLDHTGLGETSYVQCELLRSINQRRLVHRLGAIDRSTHLAVDEVLRTLLSH